MDITCHVPNVEIESSIVEPEKKSNQILLTTQTKNEQEMTITTDNVKLNSTNQVETINNLQSNIDNDQQIENNVADNQVVIDSTVRNHQTYRIGYWWGDKKCHRFKVDELTTLFAERNCTFIKLDLDKPIETQGPFSVIVHKLSDIMVKADMGDLFARKTISSFETYARKHPDVVILDSLENNRILLDRYRQYRLIEQSGLTKAGVVFAPPFVHLTSTNIDVNRGRIKRSGLTFPVVCKPILAQGLTSAHQMCVIFNEAGLKDVKPPCVAQSFINHNARMFKLFVIKDKYYVRARPSLKNFYPGDHETVFFYSHDISKPNSTSELTALDKNETETSQESIGAGVGREQEVLEPCPERIRSIVNVLKEKLGLVFFGVDIIIENQTQKYAIIDMNTFPGYDGVDSFLTIFRDVIVDAIPKPNDLAIFSNQAVKTKRKPTDIDSGIESA